MRPRRVIHWDVSSTWTRLIREQLRPFLTANALRDIKATDTTEYYVDELSAWLALLADHIPGSTETLVNAIALRLAKYSVRTYHGCRPSDLSSYQRYGLRVHRNEELRQELRNLCQEDQRLSWLAASFEKRTSEVDRNIDEGKAFVVIDKRALLEFSAHYLIYGGEWKCAVLGHGNRQPLFERGTPTILHVDLPLNKIDLPARRELATVLVAEWIRKAAHPRAPVRILDFSFVLTSDLEPSCIAGHEHPLELSNPLEGFRTYRVVNRCCGV